VRWWTRCPPPDARATGSTREARSTSFFRFCSGHRASTRQLAPDLFELSDDLLAVARVRETDAEAAVEAASACPMSAIRLVEIRADATWRAA
jgi:ferredoxin